MLKFRFLIYAILLLLLVNLVSAATIHGTVYDLSLKKQNNVKVEINTNPKQVIVAQNGTYSFNVPNGAYVIKAQLIRKNTIIASVQENITIKQVGDYVIDLILFPDIEEGIEDIDLDVDEDIVEAKKNNISVGSIILLIFGIVLIGLSYFKKYKKQKKEISEEETKKEDYKDDHLKQIIEIIKKEGGRATQKDIRKQIPLSEAKISLMIAELEHKGVIEKIKKGRGNIIILKNK